MNKKVLIASLLALFVFASFVGWFLLREQKMTEESPKPPVVVENPTQSSGNIEPSANVDTSNWKTYRNEEYGFEVKYPEDWEFRSAKPFAIGGKRIVFDPIISDVNEPQLHFDLNIHRSNESPKEWYENKVEMVDSPNTMLFEEKEISGNQTLFVEKKVMGDNKSIFYMDYYYVVSHKGLILFFTFQPLVDDQSSNEKYIPMFDHMVNSIKF